MVSTSFSANETLVERRRADHALTAIIPKRDGSCTFVPVCSQVHAAALFQACMHQSSSTFIRSDGANSCEVPFCVDELGFTLI